MRTIAILLLFCCFRVSAQSKFKLDMDSFLIGITDDSDGRFIALDNEERATYLASIRPELSTAYLDTISKYFKIPKTEISKHEFSFYNKKLAKHFNEYYIAEIDTGMGYIDPKDEKEYYIYALNLDERKFKDYNKKLSFLTGFFYQCGTFQNGEVTFKTANSPNFTTALHFVSQLGFGYCETEKREYNIPNVQEVTFKPNGEYLKYFEELAKIKAINGW